MSIEDLLAEFKKEQELGNPYRAIQLAEIRFYIRRVISDCELKYYVDSNAATHHMSLVDQIVHFNRRAEDTVFVTFNYDRLIENAFQKRGRTVATLDDYISSGNSPIIKLHGSLDWLRPLSPRVTNAIDWPQEPTETFVAEHISDFEIGEIQHAAGRPRSYAYQPAISIPTREKTYECPPAHVAMLESILPKVDAVITIGWQGGEASFKSMIRQHVQHHPPILAIMGPQRKQNDPTEDRAFMTAQTNIRNMFINNPNLTFQRIGFGEAVTSTRTIRQFLTDNSRLLASKQ